jgi:hypothetical protein
MLILFFRQYNELSLKQKDSVKNVFYETSTAHTFTSPTAKRKFEYMYLGYYSLYHADLFFVALSESQEVLGYVCGALNTDTCLELLELVPSLSLFKDDFLSFPSHLHINCSLKSQGMGVGSKLINQFIEEIKFHKSCGLHIITNPSSKNTEFYAKHIFSYRNEKNLNNFPILLMGKYL